MVAQQGQGHALGATAIDQRRGPFRQRSPRGRIGDEFAQHTGQRCFIGCAHRAQGRQPRYHSRLVRHQGQGHGGGADAAPFPGGAATGADLQVVAGEERGQIGLVERECGVSVALAGVAQGGQLLVGRGGHHLHRALEAGTAARGQHAG